MNFAIDCVKSFIEENNEIWTTTRLGTKELMEIIKLSFKANFFKYGGHVYKQIKGTPMGSPSSVVIAEILMQIIEKSIFQSINHLFWFRYVDDIIACVSKDSVDDILMTINSINDSIQFTKETEVNSTINYLDMSIIRQQNGTLEFKVFRKNTHTDRYLNFNSYHPTKYKRNTARSLFCRANKICDERFLSEENKHIAEALRKKKLPCVCDSSGRNSEPSSIKQF